MDEEKEKEERYEEEEGDSIYIKIDILNCVDRKKKEKSKRKWK